MGQNQEHNAWLWSNGPFHMFPAKWAQHVIHLPLYTWKKPNRMCAVDPEIQVHCSMNAWSRWTLNIFWAVMVCKWSSWTHVGSLLRYPLASTVPRCSMYGRFIYVWANFEVNVARYSIHGASGVIFVGNWQECVTDYNQLTLPQPWQNRSSITRDSCSQLSRNWFRWQLMWTPWWR